MKKNNAEKCGIIYDIASPKSDRIVKEYQFRDNKKNGYRLSYRNNILCMAEKFFNNLRIGEWFDFLAFKNDNPNASL